LLIETIGDKMCVVPENFLKWAVISGFEVPSALEFIDNSKFISQKNFERSQPAALVHTK
jgi:hypothetical protein